MMKKIITLLLVILCCVFLVACNSSDYKKAESLLSQGNYSDAMSIYESLDGYEDSTEKIVYCKYGIGEQLFEEGDYEKALETFLALGSYEDSETKVIQCKYELGKSAYNEQNWDRVIEFLDEVYYEDSIELLASANREKGMSENSDYEFLDTLRKSVEKRLADSSKDSTDERDLLNFVNTELTFVSKYRNASFYDKKLGEMARLYIKGLDKQKQSFDNDYIYERDEEWLDGMVDRYTALNYLYEHYDFMSDSTDFISSYIAQFEKVKQDSVACKAINKDILANLNSFDSFKSAGSYAGYAVLKNNTRYTYDIVFEFTVYNQDETQILNVSQDYVQKVKPGNEYKITVDYGYNSGQFVIYTDWTIVDVKK